MLRHSLLLGAAAIVVASPGHAQRPPSREDLLDALTRHIQICAEISDTTGRLACYDKLQTRIGDVQGAATPTPLRPGLPTTPPPPGSPLTPPPLVTPGGGQATLGGLSDDPDRAFDPNRAGGYRPPESPMSKPQPAVRRTGPRPIPNFSTPQPLVTLAAQNLTYGEARYWQVTIIITSNTPRALDTQIQCSFVNAGKPIQDVYFGPVSIQPGEQITTELIGPPTTSYIDTTNCRVLSP